MFIIFNGYLEHTSVFIEWCGSFLASVKLKVMICVFLYAFVSDLRWTIPKS